MQMNGINGLISIAWHRERWSEPTLVVLVLEGPSPRPLPPAAPLPVSLLFWSISPLRHPRGSPACVSQ